MSPNIPLSRRIVCGASEIKVNVFQVETSFLQVTLQTLQNG